MILNGQAGSHEMYLKGRRRVRPSTAARPEAQVAPASPGVKANPNGSFEERCAWMRERQAKRKRR